jgi:hypothetical protein
MSLRVFRYVWLWQITCITEPNAALSAEGLQQRATLLASAKGTQLASYLDRPVTNCVLRGPEEGLQGMGRFGSKLWIPDESEFSTSPVC